MVLGDLTNKLIEKFVEEVQKDDNKRKIELYILSPVATYIEGYLKPYFLTLFSPSPLTT